MKQISRLIAFTLLTSIFVTSCEEDRPDNIDYQSEYLGVWDVTEKTGINAPQIYSVQVSAGVTTDKIVINGLYNLTGVSVVATIIDGFTLEIPQQTSDNISFVGSGTANVDFDQLSLNFTANDGSGNDVVTAIFTR